ncbi:MAG: acetyl-CoA carboxylase biotin carboxyl carrier protein [Bacteroidetes bacterium]|nr:acetyl-CoA carboxylase biotin carboxyl carrier protein [Fibrella sp.]
MDTKDIQNLLGFIAQSGLDEVNIETSDLKISVKRYGQPVTPTVPQQAVPVQAAPAALPPPAPVPQPVIAVPAAPAATSNYLTIKSPMIGTFYRSPNPESPALVEIGDDVREGTPVCIIEAMKLFNEIESELSGRIVKVLVENATPVEYDQPLFLVEPI